MKTLSPEFGPMRWEVIIRKTCGTCLRPILHSLLRYLSSACQNVKPSDERLFQDITQSRPVQLGVQ